MEDYLNCKKCGTDSQELVCSCCYKELKRMFCVYKELSEKLEIEEEKEITERIFWQEKCEWHSWPEKQPTEEGWYTFILDNNKPIVEYIHPGMWPLSIGLATKWRRLKLDGSIAKIISGKR